MIFWFFRFRFLLDIFATAEVASVRYDGYLESILEGSNVFHLVDIVVLTARSDIIVACLRDQQTCMLEASVSAAAVGEWPLEAHQQLHAFPIIRRQ